VNIQLYAFGKKVMVQLDRSPCGVLKRGKKSKTALFEAPHDRCRAI
jgi:hypothetical protein